MESFTIQPNDCLSEAIDGHYHSVYVGGIGRHTVPGTIEYYICILKNDLGFRTNRELDEAARALYGMIFQDLSEIKDKTDTELTVCVVPRAKVYMDSKYLRFKDTVRQVATELNLIDGTDYLTRTIDTQTTHNARQISGGNGIFPYKGITHDTCIISNDIEGKTIILIDDVYTPDVNIDEDAIQALLDKGVSRVIFYAVGKTLRS